MVGRLDEKAAVVIGGGGGFSLGIVQKLVKEGSKTFHFRYQYGSRTKGR